MLSFKKYFATITGSCILCFAYCLQLSAQTDTRFWFAPPDISTEHDQSDNYIELRLANADIQPVTVTITQPANTAGINRTINIQPDQSQTVSFNNLKLLLETTEGAVRNTGLLITSTGPITAYYEVGRASSQPGNTIDDKNGEIFTLKGANALGTRFFTPFQNFYNRYVNTNGVPFSDAHSSFDIVATENNTTVTFTLTRPGVNGTRSFAANTLHTINLNRGETYSVRAAGDNAGDRMTGSLITATRPIAVTMKDDSPKVTWSTGADLIGDQLVPTTVIGNNYVVVRGFLDDEVSAANQFNQNKVVIVATEPGTNIRIDSQLVASNLAAGAFYVHTIPGSNFNATSGFSQNIVSQLDKPIYVYSVSGYGGEMGGPLLPPVQCTGSSRVDFVRSNADPFFLTIIALPQALDSFYVENQKGILTRADFKFTTGGWWVAQMRMDGTGATVSKTGIPVNTGITVRNTGGYFHLGIINGTTVGGTSRFGYFSDFGKNTSALPATASVCPNTAITLDPKIIGITNTTNWYLLPNLTSPFSTSAKLTTSNPGTYTVSITDARQCDFRDTVTIAAFPITVLDLGKNTDTVCFNVAEPIVVNVNNTTNVTWPRVPSGVSIPFNTKSWNPKASGKYVVRVQDTFGCFQTDSINVLYSDSLANFALQPSQKTVCFNVKNPIVVPGGPYRTITWDAPETIAPNTLSHNPTKDGLYSVTVENRYRCYNTASVTVNFDNDLVPFNLGTDTLNVCSYEGVINVPGSGYDSIKWQGPVPVASGTSSYKPTQSGAYIVKVVNPSGCFATDTIQVQFAGDIALDLGGDSAISCQSRRTILTAVGGNYRYTWRNGNGVVASGTPTYQPATEGRYSVRVVDSIYNYCFAEDDIYVSFPDTILLNFEGDSAISCFNAGFRLCAGAGYPSYVWSGQVPPNTGNCYTPSESGRYKLTITDRFGCIKSDSVFVKYYPKIDIGLNGADTATCFPYTNSYVIRLPQGNAKYEWTPEVSSDSVYTPEWTGEKVRKFKVKVTNTDGCFDSDSVTVNFLPEIKFPGIVGGDTTACQYAKYTIKAGPGFARYVWVNNVAGEKDSLFVPSSSGKYYVTVYTARGGCSKTSDTSNVKFVSDRAITIEGRGTICSGDSIDLVATSGYETYQWMDSTAFDNQIYTPSFPESVSTSKIYRIKVVGSYEKVCKRTAERDIVFIRKNIVNLGNDTTVCPGSTIVMNAGPGYTSYSWVTNDNPGSVLSTNPVITVNKAGFYIVNLTSDCGLDSPGRIIAYHDQPDATINYTTTPDPGNVRSGNVANVCYTETASLFSKPGYTSYKWMQSGMTPTLSTSNSINVNDDGLFYVTVTDSNTCIDVDSITVLTNDSCFFIPNLVTPNGDQYNQDFKIKGIRQNTWQLEVYNRWGDRVYLSKGYNNDWDASEVGDGVYYYYLVHPTDDRKYKGWVQILSKN